MIIRLWGLLALFVLGLSFSINPAVAGSSSSDSGGGLSGYIEFVKLDPLILPIIDNNGVSQVVTLVVVLEVPNASAGVEARRIQPKLKDAFIQDMYGALNRKAALQGGVIKVAAIKNRLNKISQKILGPDKVNDVLLEVVQQRPI